MKKPGKSIVKWDEEFANLAKESTKKMALPSAKWLSIRGGKLTYGGVTIPNPLRAVIVGWTYENQFYDTAFDPNSPAVPICYAFGEDREDMSPHEQASDKQSDSCATCEHNQWESDGKGRGKACKNVIRLALIAEGELENIDSPEVIHMKLPVTSVKNFTTYAKKIVADTLSRPYWAVVTEISAAADPYPKVTFAVGEKIEDNKLFTPLKALWEKSTEGITFPYQPISEEARAPRKPAGKKPKFSRR